MMCPNQYHYLKFGITDLLINWSRASGFLVSKLVIQYMFIGVMNSKIAYDYYCYCILYFT